MDILASILAYLGAITGILGALAVSAFLLVSGPQRPEVKGTQHSAAIAAKAVTAKNETAPQAVAKVNQATPATTSTAPREASVAPSETTPQSSAPAQSSEPAQTSSASRKPVVSAARQKAQAARAQYLRRFVQEERAKRWAYHQDPDFEARFLGYTD